MILLVELLVIETLHISINTADNIENNTYYDDKSRTRNEEINIRCSTRTENSKVIINFRDRVWKYSNDSQE